MSTVNEFLGGLDIACGTTPTLPALPADPYCIGVPGYSQIWGLIVTPCTAADPLEIVSSNPPSEVAGEIDNDNADNTKSRLLVGIGTLGEHEPKIYEGPLLADIVTGRSFTLEFQVPISGATTYAFLQAMQRNPHIAVKFRFWFIDLSNWVYGPILASTVTDAYGGIRPNFVNVQIVNAGGREDRRSATITMRFEADVNPPAYVSPITYATACEPA